MLQFNLRPEYRDLLVDIVDGYLGDLREEICDTDNFEYRNGLNTTLSFPHGTQLINETLGDQLTNGRGTHPIRRPAMDRGKGRTPLIPSRGKRRGVGVPPDDPVAVPAIPAKPRS